MTARGILLNTCRFCLFSAWNHLMLLPGSPLVKVQILTMIFMIYSLVNLGPHLYQCPCYSLLSSYISLLSVPMSAILLLQGLSIGCSLCLESSFPKYLYGSFPYCLQVFIQMLPSWWDISWPPHLELQPLNTSVSLSLFYLSKQYLPLYDILVNLYYH